MTSWWRLGCVIYMYMYIHGRVYGVCIKWMSNCLLVCLIWCGAAWFICQMGESGGLVRAKWMSEFLVDAGG